MAKASDKELGLLHKKLADTMLRSLESSDTAIGLIAEYAEELPGPVLTFLEKHADANPALLTAVSKFLKDNDITCVIEDDEEMNELKERLADKQKQRKRIGNVVPMDQSE